MSLMSCRPPGFLPGGPYSTAEHWTGLAGKMIRRMSIRTEDFAPAALSHSWKRSKEEDHTHLVHQQYTHSPLAYKDHLAYRAPWHRQQTLHAERVQPPAEEPLQTLKLCARNLLAKETTDHIVTCKNIISLDICPDSCEEIMRPSPE